MRRPPGTDASYYETKKLCMYVDPAHGSQVECQFPHAMSRLTLRFDSRVYGREIPLSFTSDGRLFRLEGVVVVNEGHSKLYSNFRVAHLDVRRICPEPGQEGKRILALRILHATTCLQSPKVWIRECHSAKEADLFKR